MGDFIADFWWVLLLLAGLVVLAIVAIAQDGKNEAKFMAECLQDHKQYECTAMWRAGEDHTTVMPMPMVISR